jgi:hypothetical protein
MSALVFQTPNFTVTPTAVAMLTKLTAQYQKKLKFRLFVNQNERLEFRVHDKDYPGDLTLSTGDIGIAFCKELLSKELTLSLDCDMTETQESGFMFRLYIDHKHTVCLSGDQAIARIVSTETEICDAYGEYCYTVYA